MPEMSKPILYSFRRCPYAMRARMALVASEQQVELREILLRDKPAHMVDVSPKATVPVLILDENQVLEESLDIMLWTLRHNDPESWLNPELCSLSEMLALIHEMDGDFKHHLDHYKYSSRHAGAEDDPQVYAEQHRAAAMDILLQLEARLKEWPFLFGSRISLADVAIAPFVRQFANTDIDWFSRQPAPKLQAWLQAFLQAPLFTSVMSKYKPWVPGGETLLFPPNSQAEPA